MSASKPTLSISLPVTPGRKTDLHYIGDNSNHPRLTLLKTFLYFQETRDDKENCENGLPLRDSYSSLEESKMFTCRIQLVNKEKKK